MRWIAAVIAVVFAFAGCASSSQVDDLEARVEALEGSLATAESTTGATEGTAGDTRDLDVQVRADAETDPDNGGIRCYVGDWPLGADTVSSLTSGAGVTLSTTRIGPHETCQFSFTFPSVPTDEGAYVITVSGAEWPIGQEELDRNGWTVILEP